MSTKLANTFAEGLTLADDLRHQLSALESKRDRLSRELDSLLIELGKTVGEGIRTKAYILADGRVLIIRFRPESPGKPGFDIYVPVTE